MTDGVFELYRLSTEKKRTVLHFKQFFRTWAPSADWTLIVLNKLSQEENFRKDRVQIEETYLHLKIFLFRYNFSSLQNKKVNVIYDHAIISAITLLMELDFWS